VTCGGQHPELTDAAQGKEAYRSKCDRSPCPGARLAAISERRSGSASSVQSWSGDVHREHSLFAFATHGIGVDILREREGAAEAPVIALNAVKFLLLLLLFLFALTCDRDGSITQRDFHFFRLQSGQFGADRVYSFSVSLMSADGDHLNAGPTPPPSVDSRASGRSGASYGQRRYRRLQKDPNEQCSWQPPCGIWSRKFGRHLP